MAPEHVRRHSGSLGGEKYTLNLGEKAIVSRHVANVQKSARCEVGAQSGSDRRTLRGGGRWPTRL